MDRSIMHIHLDSSITWKLSAIHFGTFSDRPFTNLRDNRDNFILRRPLSSSLTAFRVYILLLKLYCG